MNETHPAPIHLVRRGPLLRNTGGPARVAADILEIYRQTNRYERYGYISVNGHEVYSGNNAVETQSILDSAVKHKAGSLLNATNIGLYLQLLRDRHRLRKRLRRLPPWVSILHSHDQVASGLIAGQTTAPHVLTIHSKGSILEDVKLKVHPQIRGAYMERAFRKVERDGIETATVVTFPSKGAKEIFECDYPGIFEQKDVRIVYNGIEWAKFETITRRQRQEGFTLLSVCALTDEKRFDRVLHVVAELRRRGTDVHLLHAGSGALREQMIGLAQELGIRGNVVFLGSMNHGEIMELFGVADAYILAGERVVFDLATLEAMAAGLPVILSDTGGNRETVADGLNGFLCTGDDRDAFAGRIEMLMNNPGLAAGMGRAARNEVQTRFTLQAMTDAFHAIYIELLERAGVLRVQ